MTMKLVMLASALSLVACGGGDLRGGGGYDDKLPPDNGVGAGPAVPPLGSGGEGTGTGGSGWSPGSGGTGQAPVAGTSWGGSFVEGGASNGEPETGGYGGSWPSGGTSPGSGGVSPGGGGASQGGEGGVAGEGQAGSGGVSGGGSELSCLANVAHCFDAAANCYAYSPGSDCDQIVDVCADMQADCGNPAP